MTDYRKSSPKTEKAWMDYKEFRAENEPITAGVSSIVFIAGYNAGLEAGHNAGLETAFKEAMRLAQYNDRPGQEL